ncbi:MAG: SGNH/GDSL hydrolase family protein [Lentisphaeria bacterium]|nr:SGNH/GDSL hydrolase family protein [Lentisphaeria bacterium]
MKIEDIDKNFVPAKVGDRSIYYFDVTKSPFVLEGLGWFERDHKYYRLPADFTTDDVNEGALYLANNTSGVAVRFRSNSKVVVLRAKLAYSGDMNHMPRLGSAGFDLYRGVGSDKFHVGSAQPGRDQEILELVLNENTSGEMQEWTLNFPLYGGAEKVEIGVDPDAVIEAPTPHAVAKPILFYGSSITQGGCASRPGNAYTSMLCRAVDAPQINLGFSGCGRGEFKVAEAIAGLDLACFVMDYDHNAPSAEHLEETHEKFFKIIRQRNPQLPIIIMTKCDIWHHTGYEINSRRREIIRRTYDNAVAAGDKNVYFIDGETLFGDVNRNECTVDTCHPNDLGFYRMFEHVLPTLRKALKLEK